jgi:predicted nucleic acid-binding protein
MANDVFIDTSGFYALLVKDDDRHAAADSHLRELRRKRARLVTSDYILDETATLLKARGRAHLLKDFFEKVATSKACQVEWTDAGRFDATRTFFLKHADQAWSFTDCLCFHIMKELRIREALTKDAHFHEAGFVVLLK